ncbi:MAG: (2Fe-2S)-binding protein [Candidatus Tectomicrobia bacterium]
MDKHHRQHKDSRSNRKASAYDASKQTKGFAGLDPSNMGLDMPEWLAETVDASPSPAPTQDGDTPPDDAASPSRTLLEGLKVVCICKGIKMRTFWRVMDEGAQTHEEINRETGSGSGQCRGRRCGPRILDMLRNLPS